MNKYVNEISLKTRKTYNTIKLTIGIVGAVFWGLICVVGFAVSESTSDIFMSFICLIFSAVNVYFVYDAVKTKALLSMVYLYARYFEGDLDGYIDAADITKIVNKSEYKVYSELQRLLKKKVMRSFILRSNNGKKQIVLQSKIKDYKCKNCGGTIEKRIDFAGICPYCGGSDIFAELDDSQS